MNLKEIESPHLKHEITLLYDRIIELISSNINSDRFEIKKLVKKLIYNHVLGVGVPICISDGDCFYKRDWGFVVIVQIDYKVTSLYKPYQDLDKPLSISIFIDNSIIREYRLKLLEIN